MTSISGPVTAGERWRMEALSQAYVKAVACAAGCDVSDVDVDRDSIDVSIRRRTLDTSVISPQIDVQLKATHKNCIVGNEVQFQLKKRAYDRLRATNCLVPCILVVLHVPPMLENWTDHSEARLLLRNSAYWFSLRGMADLAPGKQSAVLRIPRSQVFDVKACDELFTLVAAGGKP